ncbi:MAG: response regulator, partial [Anaerolineales bacterium]
LDEFVRSSKNRLRILLVEDEKEQAWSVETWLGRLGQHVETVGSAEAALESLEKSLPDLALVDVGLPGMDGVALAQRILDLYPGVRVVSATDWARADRMTDALNGLRERGVELLMKPLLPEDLLRIIEQEKPQTAELRKLESDIQAPLLLNRAANQKLANALRTLLQQARKRLGFELGILFAFDANNRSVSILELAGDAYLARHAIPSLVYSPVRDVAEDGDTLFSGEILPAERNRFKYLYELYPTLGACIGLKVPTQSKLHYALFLLDKHPKSIPEEYKLYAEAIALAIGSVLEHNLFRERAIVIQRTALIGHLTSALVHEINNLISPLYTRIDGIRRNVDFLEKRD